MLASGDREYLKFQILACIASDVTPRQTIARDLPFDILVEIEEGLRPQVLVERVLALCEADGWRRTPPLLCTLMTSLLGDSGRIPELIAKLATPPRAAVAVDPFTTSVLDTRLPFLDRLPTRNVVRSWTSLMPVQQVMVVEGPSQSGKTYTNEFVRHIVRDTLKTTTDVRTVMISLEKDQAMSIGAVELAKDLVWNMGADPDEAPGFDTNTTAFIKQLVSWVLRVANRDGLKWWFALDGFRASRPGEEPPWQLKEDTREFLVAFVKGLTNGINTTRHRLLLLDFDRAILPLPPGAIGLDVTRSVSRATVRIAIEAIITMSGSGLDPDAVEADILRDLSNPVAELVELNARLVDLMAVA